MDPKNVQLTTAHGAVRTAGWKWINYSNDANRHLLPGENIYGTNMKETDIWSLTLINPWRFWRTTSQKTTYLQFLDELEAFCLLTLFGRRIDYQTYKIRQGPLLVARCIWSLRSSFNVRAVKSYARLRTCGRLRDPVDKQQAFSQIYKDQSSNLTSFWVSLGFLLPSFKRDSL